jgi:hypothetical protein
MKKVLIIVYNDLHHDARLMRQVNFLKDSYEITVVCFDAPSLAGIEIIKIKKIKPTLFQKAITSFFLLTRFYDAAYKVLYDFPILRKQLRKRSFDLIISNDIETLPLSFNIKKKEKILFDAHEFAPTHYEEKLIWKLLFQGFNQYLCKKYLPKVDQMITVGYGLAKEYAAHYPVKPIVLTNASPYINLSPGKINSDKIKLIHHGAASPTRQLEVMIEMMDYVDNRFSLDLMLLIPTLANRKTREYLSTLRKRVDDNPRVKIIPSVGGSQVVEFIHQYDIGVYILPPISFNTANSLPNKLFDFIQARLAIAIGPTPEMANIVNTYNLGVVADDFTAQSLAKKINSLTSEQILFFKNQANNAAKELSAEKNKVILNELVTKLLSE